MLRNILLLVKYFNRSDSSVAVCCCARSAENKDCTIQFTIY